jgi:hypothetical protein
MMNVVAVVLLIVFGTIIWTIEILETRDETFKSQRARTLPVSLL